MDTTKIRVGDKIRLRNGDVKTVADVEPQNDPTYPRFVDWEDGCEDYTKDGLYMPDSEYPLDIVEIIPAETPEKTPISPVETTDDPINPSHYTKGDSTYGYIKSWKMNYEEGCIVKYITRWRHKNPANAVQDLEKARWYLDELITRAETEGVENV